MEQAGPAGLPSARLESRWLTLAASCVLLGLVLRAAWLSDDAFITLRTVDNWVSGYGLRWNVSERVQAFTHPLWLLLLSISYWFTREPFFTTIFLGVSTTACALWLLVKLGRSTGHAFVALFLLMISRSFIDYSTSGLENSLSHLLVALFVLLYAVRESSLGLLTFCAALLALNRSDALLVALPALSHLAIVSFRAQGPRETARSILLGASPLLFWELFSLFYYGSLVPNTALAKLNTGLPSVQLVRQGFTYILSTLAWDPPLLIVVGLGIGIAIAQRRLRESLLALGRALHVSEEASKRGYDRLIIRPTAGDGAYAIGHIRLLAN